MKYIKLFENFKKSDLDDDGISLCQEVQDLLGIECNYKVSDDFIMVKSIDNVSEDLLESKEFRKLNSLLENTIYSYYTPDWIKSISIVDEVLCVIIFDGKWLMDILNSLTIKVSDIYPGSILYVSGDELYIHQDSKNEHLLCHYYKLWLVFESKYRLDNQEIRGLLKGTLNEHLKLKGYTPVQQDFA